MPGQVGMIDPGHLLMILQVVEHGGGIRVQSAEGQGSVFTVFFPGQEAAGQEEELVGVAFHLSVLKDFLALLPKVA